MTGTEFHPVKDIPDLEGTLQGLSRKQKGRDSRWRQRAAFLWDRYPVMSYVLLATNAFIFLLMTLAGGSTQIGVLVGFGAQEQGLIMQGQVWRLIMACFLHIGILHILFNSYALYILGPWMEEIFGRRRAWIIYIVSGIAGFAASARRFIIW